MPMKRIAHEAGSVQASGALVWSDSAPSDAPLLLVAPNWLGVTDGAIAQGAKIAGDRFVVFVADMFGGGLTATGPQDAAPLADALRHDWQERRRRISAAYQAMLSAAAAEGFTSRRTAAIGFCFGGGNVLELARAGTPAKAVISLHGDLGTHQVAAPGCISASLLILHGSADPVAPKSQRDAFEAEMEAAGATWSMLTFGGVLHSFAEEGPPVPGVAEFDPRAARLSFQLIEHFLDDAWTR